MIKIDRSAKPSILEKKATEWTQKLLTAATAKGKKNAEGKYQHKQIKEALIELFHGKCAYCESKITHIDYGYGHIEHFKPKSHPIYRALTFEWTNLLLACGVCNGSEHKGKKFPSNSAGGPFVNPCQEKPDDHFEFVYDQTSKLATVVGKTKRGETTERLLGLNRHALREYRSKQVRKLISLKKFAGADPEAETIFQEAQQDNAEYAAFARAIGAGASSNGE